MRFLNRSSSWRPQDTTANDVLPRGDNGLPANAEISLGTNSRLGWRKTDKQNRRQAMSEHVPNEEQENFGTILRAQEAILDKQQALRKDVPIGRNASLLPNVEEHYRSANDLLHPSRRPGIPPRKTSSHATLRRVESMLDGPVDPVDRKYYDPSKQPFYISQQTSASAVRDKALRKGSPTIHEISSDPSLTRRPLKSAMKKTTTEPPRRPDDLLRVRTNSSEKRAKKLDLSQFFPRPKGSAGRLLYPNKTSHSPSTLTEASELIPQEALHAQLRRPPANARFQILKGSKAPLIESTDPARAKVFEPNIFDTTKANVRRPPKGIQNWFDGFEISSDEEPEPQAEPQELPANEAIPSTFSPWVQSSKEELPKLGRKVSGDPVKDNVLAIVHAKMRKQERLRIVNQQRGSVDVDSSTLCTMNSVVSSQVTGRRTGGESRLAMSCLANESVLSLSSSSSAGERTDLPPIIGSVDDTGVIEDAPTTEVQTPSNSPRKLHSKRSILRESFPRQSSSTGQASGSIPINLLNETPLLFAAKRNTQTTHSNSEVQALRKSNDERDSETQPSSSRQLTRSVPHDHEVAMAGEDTSSMHTDGSHLMAVTEEEMILLERMRQKRAAMQKNSFAEGYQLALQREQEHLARRRVSAQQTAMRILRQKEERTAAKNHPSSRVETVADSEIDQRTRLSAVGKEDVDKLSKVERVLRESRTPIEEALPSPPVVGDAVQDAALPPQHFKLLLPETYSPARSRLEKEPVSTDGPSSLPEEDIEDHHDKIRAFLASTSPSKSAGVFPMPPSSKLRQNSRPDKRKSMLSLSSNREEEVLVPVIPPRSPRRTSPTHTSEGRQSMNGSTLPSNIDVDSRVQTAPTFACAKPSDDYYNPDNLLPNVDFPPLEFASSAQAGAGSPSLSTSRASPLTPTFATTALSDKNTFEIAGSDNASIHGRANTPDTDLTFLFTSANAALMPMSVRKPAPSQKLPLRLDPVVSPGLKQRADMTSTSAGEDVFAAWAELGGGGGEVLASRRLIVR